MQCQCGALTTEREHVRGQMRLRFDECPRCERCGHWRMYYGRELHAVGEGARLRFNQEAER